jgi:Bacterial membrane protein YfhO
MMNWKVVFNREGVRAGLILALILNAVFLPALWGGRTLLASAWSVPSVTPSGAYHQGSAPRHFALSPDPGAPGWTLEPWIKVISEQYRDERRAPLWNPYNAYGAPFAAAMQPQPFFPLTALLSLNPTPWTYNLFVIARLFLAGLLTFLFARLFLDFAASLFAAISFMLSGYFVIYLDMPHLSVETLLPGLFLAFELLLRKNSWPTLAFAALVVCLCVLGGMPESSFLIISFGCLYGVFRLLQSAELRSRIISRASRFGAALILGFALSAFLLLPFIEFMANAHDTHQPGNLHGEFSGLAIDGDWRFAITYFFPFLFGRTLVAIFGGPWGGMRGYWGVLPILFSAVAICGLLRRRGPQPDPRKSLTVFFFVLLVLMLLKRFGDPLVNWIGRLPIASLVVFVKYQEPLMAFCVAVLAGIGFSIVVKQRVGFRYLSAAAAVTALLIASVAAWCWPLFQHHQDVALNFYWALVVAAIIICSPLVLCCFSSAMFPRARWLPWSLVGLLSAELFCNFILPNFYIYNALPPAASYNPYNGAPYIDYLRANNTEKYRVFGRDGILFPNWSAAFDLMDVRALDAMYYRRYISFIRNFLLRPGDEERIHDELADRFTGGGNDYVYHFDSDLERRFLALSSIKYVLSANELPPPADKNESLTKVYDKELCIYEFSAPLPRAGLFYAAEVVPDAVVARRLKDPSFNVHERIILSAESLPAEGLTSVSSLSRGNARPIVAAKIVTYESQHVEIETQSDAPAILMFNDSNYPGWYATVNGAAAPILTADYLFRSVVVPAGHAVVRFDYAPASFRIGAAISLASLLVLAVPLVAFGARRRRVDDVTRAVAVPQAAEFARSPERSSRMDRLDQFEIVINRRNGKVVASIPRLSLYAKGNSVEDALAALDAKKSAFAAELEDIGELDIFQAPTPVTADRMIAVSAPGDLSRFALKTTIVAVALAAVLVVSGLFMASSVQNVVSSVNDTFKGGPEFWGKVERELDRMASPEGDLPEAKKQKFLADIRAIGAKWRPFLIELHSALGPPNEPPAQQPGQSTVK